MKLRVSYHSDLKALDIFAGCFSRMSSVRLKVPDIERFFIDLLPHTISDLLSILLFATSALDLVAQRLKQKRVGQETKPI